MRPVRPSPLAVACLHLGLAVSATAVFSQENAYIDAGSPRVWSFNEAEIHGPAGFSGMAKLYGTTVDGERHLLFETTVGYRKSLSATYYAWPDLVSVSFEGFDGDGAALAVSFRLPAWKSSQQAGDVDVYAILSTLGFPYRQTPWGLPPASISDMELAGKGGGLAESTASVALSRLFIPARRVASLVLLCLWTVVVMASGYWPKRQPWNIAMPILCATAVAALLWFSGSGSAELYSIAIPQDALGLSPGGNPEHLFFRQAARHKRYSLVSYEESAPVNLVADERKLFFITVRSPLSSAIPVSALDRYPAIRFQSVPIVTIGKDGDTVLKSGPLALAWGVHE